MIENNSIKVNHHMSSDTVSVDGPKNSKVRIPIYLCEIVMQQLVI